MRIEIGRVPVDQAVGFPTDSLEISPLLRGQLGVRLVGIVPGTADVRLLDSGELVCLSSDVEVEVFEA